MCYKTIYYCDSCGQYLSSTKNPCGVARRDRILCYRFGAPEENQDRICRECDGRQAARTQQFVRNAWDFGRVAWAALNERRGGNRRQGDHRHQGGYHHQGGHYRR
ncbi:hypothetical protein HYALB_00010792 [Hymenoscyphus albidus]|uniref:Uncharacterized protein n=1 Tax=Hymenoscyphus albidus TaxID=595503 RepID=A0A9N9QA12_9HELO|nr:hypothetical protein HYALB_00010792 [Hymenoscyphus albidus]